jgi:BON domain
MKGIGCMRILVAIGLTLGAVAPAAAQAPPPPVVLAAAEATPPLPNPDAAITASIKARMEANILFRNAQIIISTEGGYVTLSGTVMNDFAHQKALDITRSTVGVTRIDDQLRLDISSPSAPARN